MAATASKRKKPRAYPFVFFRHGPWGYPDEIEGIFVSVIFAADVPDDVRREIETSAPAPIGDFRWPLASLMTFGPAADDYFDAQVARAFGAAADVARRADVAQFCAALDAWLCAAHARAPVTVVLGWIGASPRDPWAAWSAAVALERALPRLLALAQDPRVRAAPALHVALARRTREVVALRFERQELAELPAAEQALVKATLVALLGVDERTDHDVRWLYRRLTKEPLPT